MPVSLEPEKLKAAELIARRIKEENLDQGQSEPHRTIEHLGALLAATVLQAHASFELVVMPRVERIESKYPKYNTIHSLMQLIEQGDVADFLDLKKGAQKNQRFENLVKFLNKSGINTIEDLRKKLGDPEFCSTLREVDGIGRKSVDFIKIYAGLDSIAIDQHLINFAQEAGVTKKGYVFLQDAYLEAAKNLNMSARDLDIRIWRKQSAN